MLITAMNVIVPDLSNGLNLQQCIHQAAQQKFLVWIPSNYSGSDTFTNPQNIQVFDCRGSGWTNATTLRGVIPDSEKIEPFLKLMARSKATLARDQIGATRQKIGDTVRKLPWDSPIRRDFIQLRSAIDHDMEHAAEQANNPPLSDAIKSLRSQYAQTNAMLEERAILTLRDKNPDAVANVLINKETTHNVNVLRRLIGPQNMQAVEGSILYKMIQNASKMASCRAHNYFAHSTHSAQMRRQPVISGSDTYIRIEFECAVWQSGPSGSPIIAMMPSANPHSRNHVAESRGQSSRGWCSLPKPKMSARQRGAPPRTGRPDQR